MCRRRGRLAESGAIREVSEGEADVPELYVGNEAEFEEEGCKIVALGDVEIGVFRVHGDFYAYRNVCAHRGGPVCQGRIMRKVEEIELTLLEVFAEADSKGLPTNKVADAIAERRIAAGK